MPDTDTTPIDLALFKSAARLLIEVPLKVAPGTNGRFQPTGFPDLGPALYKGVREFEEKDDKGGSQKVQRAVNMLFSDTAAALGNWLEEACLSGEDYNPDCEGIPYVRVLDGDGAGTDKPFLTSSVREPHRLASPYVLSAKREGSQETMKDWLRKPEQFAVNKQRPVRSWSLAQKLFNIDPGCILHGVFLEELDGRLRLPRLLSGFIEAANPNQVNYGGVYRGEVTASDNIPFPKQEFTSDDIQASFILHLSTLHGHKLAEHEEAFLILWALYKIDELLRGSLRLRSGCEFIKTAVNPTIDGEPWLWPTTDKIKAEFQAVKDRCFPEVEAENDRWKKHRVAVVTWAEDIAPTRVRLPEGLSIAPEELGDYASRIGIKEHDFAPKPKKGQKATSDKGQALFVKGNWEEGEFEEMLSLFPEQIEDERGEQVPNPKHALVKEALKAHDKALKDRKKAQEKKSGGETPEEPMSVAISIRFLTGRAHLHHWQAHHSDGKVDWPPAPWRLLRALVAAAGCGLTSLPEPLDLKIVNAAEDDLPISRLAKVLALLAAPPVIWLPRTGGGHTRQFLPKKTGSTGSAVFDTFATVSKETPVVFEWPDVPMSSDDQRLADLQTLLRRVTYFGRAESWCDATASISMPTNVKEEITHWPCLCRDSGERPKTREHTDYTLERRLAPEMPLDANLRKQAAELLPQCGFKVFEPKTGKKAEKWRTPTATEIEAFKARLAEEDEGVSLLRCLLRSTGDDIKTGLERPIGTRWVQYAVPRAIYQLPAAPRRIPRRKELEMITLVRFALNTATVNRAVLPPVTDTLLVADKFRAAALAWHGHLQGDQGEMPRNLCGREDDGSRAQGHDHAYFWPMDEDDDGLIDHVSVFCCRGFETHEVDALRRLLRLKQRGGRPDLLVTPVFLGQHEQLWPQALGVTTFVSATPYFCPLHLTHGKGRSGRPRPLLPYIMQSLRETLYLPDGAPEPVIQEVRHLPDGGETMLQHPDEPPSLGTLSGFFVDDGTRFIRSLSFGRRRRQHEVKGPGRCFQIIFATPRSAVPFSLGDQAHFGLGLFVPAI